MRKEFFVVIFIVVWNDGFSCITCNKALREGIYNSTFFPNLLTMLSAFILLAVIIIVLARFSSKRFDTIQRAHPDGNRTDPVPMITASMILGIGVGGFIDGIVLHQVLQWHEMLSAKVTVFSLLGKSINMFWDGIFHFFCLIVVAVGIHSLWRVSLRNDTNRSGRLLVAGMLAGWGLFNLVEGLIDHHLLKLHNVKDSAISPDAWNYSFLAVSLFMVLAGYLMIKPYLRPLHVR